jgi:trans-aconitate methyltransferase
MQGEMLLKIESLKSLIESHNIDIASIENLNSETVLIIKVPNSTPTRELVAMRDVLKSSIPEGKKMIQNNGVEEMRITAF